MSSEERVTAPVPSSFDRDLENARVLIEESPWKDNPQKYRKVAEGILRRILTFDPTNKSAKRLLEKSLEIPVPVAEPGPSKVQAVVEVPISTLKEVPVPAPKIETPPAPKVETATASVPPPRRPVRPPDFSFVVETGPAFAKKERPKPPGLLLAIATVGAIAGVTLLVAHRNTITPPHRPNAPVAAPKAPAAAPNASAAAPKVVQALPAVVPVAAAETSSSTAAIEKRVPPAPPVPPSAPAKPAVPVEPAPKREAAPAQPVVATKSNVQPVAPLETGTLAVSSPTTVDIYRGDQLVGSAPTTLILPVGNQTLEYRHQDMRKLITSAIKSNQTTTAMVTFDVTVQINAKPWAQVFIDGSPRQPLGQTPLSNVRVPIGSNLIFENPNFPGKSYRITGKETEIRMTFP
jgi:hypothetical protein